MRNYLFDRDPAPNPVPVHAVPDGAAKKSRGEKGRIVLSAVTFLLLICVLTVAAVWLRDREGSMRDHLEDAAGGDYGYDGGYGYDDGDPFFGIYPGLRGGKKTGTSIPKAPAGVEPLLFVSEAAGEALAGEDIYRKVLPSVVCVSAYSMEYGSTGSGIVLSADGYIITNYHVIEGMDRATVTPLVTGETSPARLVGYDAETDVAVLKVEADDLVPAEFGSSRNLSIGEKVYAIGNPMGYLYGTFTDGIVSYIDRPVSVGGHSMALIQTNVALNSGNSGGPLVNQWGQVVGIAVAKIDPPSEITTEGLGLAIPISEARRCVNTLLRLGKMENPVIGILGMSWKEGDGVLVDTVDPGGPADEAGLLAGDVILTAGGVAVDSVDALKDVIYDLGVGAEMPCTVLRGHEELELVMALREG